jgi:hypothetical protein
MGDHQFETDRTKRFRQTSLPKLDEEVISNIEEYGCHVVQVARSAGGPGWSYSIGVYDSCAMPELITIGLRENTALYLLNEAAKGLRDGIDLSHGRHSGLLGTVDCEFRPVDPKWVKHVMGWAVWFYEGDLSFPVWQAVYPDLQNRFPEDPGFDSAFAQPLLQPNVIATRIEEDFWASNDRNSSLFDWTFPDPPHTQVFLSESVHSGTEPVTYASHDSEDGAWQFLGDSMSGGRKPVISCFHHPVDADPSLKELADLPLGWWAERTRQGEPWIRHQHEEEESDGEASVN